MRSWLDTVRWSRTDVSRNVGYLAGVDHLRGAAALLMVLYHGYQQLGGREFVRAANPLEAVLIEGHTAVALFMVLSGFIFTYGVLGAPEGSRVRYGGFMRNRLLRVAPMYVLVVGLAVYTEPGGYSVGGLVQLFTLQGTPPIARSDLGAFGALLWTISVEFAFYLAFPFLVRFLQRNGPLHLVGIVVLMNVLRLLSASLHPEQIRDLSYWTIVGRLDQFLVGMLVAWWVVRRAGEAVPRSAPAAWLGVAVAAVVVVAALALFNRHGSWPASVAWKAVWPLAEALVWAGFTFAYLAASRTLPRRVATLLALPGIVSYSAYLLHYAIVVALRDGPTPLFGARGRADALLSTVLVVVPATFAVATLAYLVVERPFMQLRGRYLDAPAAEPSALPVAR